MIIGLITEIITNPLWDEGYAFWSGIGSDLAYLAFFFGAVRLYKRRTECHVEGCAKHGQLVHGTPYRACHEHDPRATHEPGESITAKHIAAAHAEHSQPS